jgi:hypothetical protein
VTARGKEIPGGAGFGGGGLFEAVEVIEGDHGTCFPLGWMHRVE